MGQLVDLQRAGGSGDCTSSSDSRTTLASYRYDPLGRRIAALDGSGKVIKRSVYDLDGTLLAELDGQARPQQLWLHLGGRPVALIDARAVSAQDEGCGCRLGATPGGLMGLGALALLGLLWRSRRRWSRLPAVLLLACAALLLVAAGDGGSSSEDAAGLDAAAQGADAQGTTIEARAALPPELASARPLAVVTDVQGTPLSLITAGGAAVWQRPRTPYFRGKAQTDPDGDGVHLHVSLGAPGQVDDRAELGLPEAAPIHHGVRLYDARAGQFLSPDPVALLSPDLARPQRQAPYAYAANDPLLHTDRSGLAIDIAADVGFILWDLYKLATDPCDKVGNLMALGADIAGAVLPVVTGLGAAVRAGRGAARGASRGTTRFVDCARVVDRRTGQVLEGTVDLKPTLDRIKSGRSFPHRNDGSVFRNGEGLLPSRPEGYYREFVHPTPGVRGPGPQRVVQSQGGELFYTPDHYGTFIPLN
jgi:RHS repeat-associated protein/MYXO-CTERM domain-containing protein